MGENLETGVRQAALVLSPNSMIHWQRRQHPDNIVVDGVTISIPIYIEHQFLSQHSSSFDFIRSRVVAFLPNLRNLGDRMGSATNNIDQSKSRRTILVVAIISNDAIQKTLGVRDNIESYNKVCHYAALQVFLIEAAIFSLIMILFTGLTLRWTTKSSIKAGCFCTCGSNATNSATSVNMTYLRI